MISFSKFLILWISLFSIAFCAFASTNQAQVEKKLQQVMIHLPVEQVTDTATYTLGDIATLEGLDGSNLEKLANIQIGRSPLPGRSIRITRSFILSKLRPHINLKNITISGARNLNLQRSALKINGEEIQRAVLEHLHVVYHDSEIKPKIVDRIRDVFLPKGELTYEVISKRKYKKEGGYRTYHIVFQIDGKEVKQIPVRVYLKIYKDIYVAKDTIRKNQTVQETHLLKVRKNIDRTPSAYITNKEDLVGKIAKRTINPNEILQSNTIEKKPLIQPSDPISIVYETSSFRITTPGISLAKGRLGDRIPVRNADTKAVIYAKVTSKHFVEVN